MYTYYEDRKPSWQRLTYVFNSRPFPRRTLNANIRDRRQTPGTDIGLNG
jgi:hypothetical protein